MTRPSLFLGLGLLFMAVHAGAQTVTAPIVEIRIHGNHSTPDADVLALTGLAVGQPASDDVLEAARARVEASGRFDAVTVRRLERSIDTPDDFMVLVEVTERPGVSPDDLTPGWVTRLTSERMWVPVVRYEEGYGVTYGLQTALDGVFGGTSQLAVPATWGGERRIGVEGTRSFEGRGVSRVQAGADLRRTEHPAFEVVEERTRVFGRLESALAASLRVGVEASHDRVRFDGARADVTRLTADLVVDTRVDPAFPRNAVWGRAAFDRLDVATGTRQRTRLDFSAAVAVPARAAVTVRGFVTTTNGTLPPYEQTMIGGGLATRGYRRGYRVGDNAIGWSVTLARPFASPLNVVRHGLRTFVDWATVYDAGTLTSEAAVDRGIGVGWFANLMAVNAYVDAGRANGKWRVHVRFGTGF